MAPRGLLVLLVRTILVQQAYLRQALPVIPSQALPQLLAQLVSRSPAQQATGLLAQQRLPR
jgi:hypothetical protein